MVTPNNGPQPDYAVDPDGMKQGIDWFLTPIITKLADVHTGHAAAHSEIKTAHANQTPGWFGGRGNNEVQLMSSSFLNAMEWQMRQLVQDQGELLQSLRDYRDMLLAHLSAARETEQQVASRFRAIDSELEGQGY